ncbi:carbohydrate ABC transporter permease [Paenibacillus sp. WQ 127069]|uniref:Carbohydrate ABC transporter permease n=1 Tax=Paenibacillus baimaensis TaxID=2982185 RepID=A0ABT2UFD6_9BACL|nr:carbohydrate ABC transporter permease [Paenibacillus sp. WQ 127069]MCU6793349.1 carbohydrate ABC transporter permease [Paenibacillus sp. WQ 127069]
MIRENASRRAFMYSNYFFLTVTGLVMLLPFLHIFAGSLSSGSAISQGRVSVIPVEWTWINYEAVLQNAAIWKSFGVTVFLTVAGTLFNLLFTSLMAYGLSKNELKGRSLILMLIVFTMIFQVPLIPGYLLIKSLGLLNSLWALIIPGTISAFNLIIMVSFFREIPEGLVDAARIDGCGEYRTWWSIILPLSLPSMSTIGLFYAVGHWNGYFNAIMYIRDPSLFPLQVKLRQLLVDSDTEALMQSVNVTLQSMEGIKMATIMVATLPILLVYPLIQKHFIKGAMLGSVKG